MKIKKPQQITLSGDKRTLRVILLIASLVLAVAAFAYGISAGLTKDAGWQTVEYTGAGPSLSSELNFQYYAGKDGASATAEYKNVCALYSQTVEKAYDVFYGDGLTRLSQDPGAAVTVDPLLYDALSQIVETGNRCLFLAPVYTEYDRVLICENEIEAMVYDPAYDPEIKSYVNQVASYINDPAHISLELLTDNRVKLTVSAEYAAFAEENGITEFLELGWLTNAFAVDYVAAAMTENGYTNGYITSNDGFTCNLDNSGAAYSVDVIDRLENVAQKAATLEYAGKTSLVYLRNYPLSQLDRYRYHSYTDGTISSCYVNPSSGMSQSATDNVLSWSAEKGCARIALEISVLYLAEQWDTQAVENLQDVHSLWFEGATLKCTDPNAALTVASNTPYTIQ